MIRSLSFTGVALSLWPLKSNLQKATSHLTPAIVNGTDLRPIARYSIWNLCEFYSFEFSHWLGCAGKQWRQEQVRKITDKVFDRLKNQSGTANLKFEDLYIAVLLVYKWELNAFVYSLLIFIAYGIKLLRIFFIFFFYFFFNGAVISISVYLGRILIHLPKIKSEKWLRYSCLFKLLLLLLLFSMFLWWLYIWACMVNWIRLY